MPGDELLYTYRPEMTNQQCITLHSFVYEERGMYRLLRKH
jgi:hypothetical protein